MKRLKSYFFTNSNLNSRGKYISLKDNAEPNETLFSDMLDSVVKPKVGSDYQDQADYNAVNTKDSTKFTTAENLPEVDTTGSLLTITTTAAVDTNLLRRKKYTVSVNTPSSISDISSRLTIKLVTPANLPKFALDNSEYTQVASQLPYFAPSVVVTTDGVDFYQTYSLKLRALESTMMTHAGVRLDSVLDSLRTDVNVCVSDAELASAVSTLNTALGLKANKVTPTLVTGYNGTKVLVNSQGVVTSVSKASSSDISNDSSVSGSTVKDALNWLKANGGGAGGASDTDGVTNLSTVAGATATDALNNLLESLSHYFVKDVVGKSNGDTLEVDKINVLTLSSDTSFTLPTPSLAYKGKVLIIVQGNGGVNRAEIFGGLQGSVIISDLSDVLIYNCVYDIGGGGNWVLISRDDSKICQIPVIVESSTHYASANENIKADALSFGANISVVIPASNSEGRVIYVYYPTGAPTAYVVNLSGGYTAVLEQGDYFLLRDNGSYWEAISSSQNTPDLSAYELIANKDTVNGYAGLDSGGKILASQLPDIAITDYLGSVASQVAMLALTGQKGDWAIRTDTGTVFIITGSNPAVIGSWTEMAYPAAAVVDVLGTSNRITVSGGTTKTIDIASTYAGQSSITTVGTLTSGALGSGFTAIADAQIASASTWNNMITTEVWGTNANYPVANTTAKILVIEQDGTLTAPRTITLTSLPTGSIVIIRGGASITATNTVSIGSFVNGASSYANALTLAYQSLTLYSLGGGFYTTNKPQFTETTTALSTSKYLRSSAGIGLNAVSSFTPSWATGASAGDLNWQNSASAILARSAGGDTIPFMAFAPFTGWQNYRPTTLQYFNGQNIASGNKPTEYGSGIGYVYYWSRSYIVRCYGESTDNYLEVLIYVNGSGVPSIVRVLQESSVFSITLSGGTLQFAGGNAYVCFEQVPQQTTTNLRGIYNWVYQQGGTDVRFQGNLALGTSTINSLTQLDLQSTSKGLGLNLVAGNLGTTRNGLVWYDTVANQFEGIQSNTVVNLLTGSGLASNKLLKWDGAKVVNSSISDVSNFVFVSVKADFPTPSGGIITLAANTTYFINGTIDLTGDRLVCSANTTIIGGSSENCRIKSTGLVSALITSVYSLPLRNITLEASLALNLDGDGTTTALDWFGVNFTDCAVIGTVKDYTNFIMSDCAFLNSGGMTLDGTFGSVGFSQCLFDCNTTNTVFILPATLTISRRFRVIYSSFVVLSGETGININASASIPTESYILDTVNFSGGGTYLTGVTHTSNDALFINCVGITNTAVNGQLYMQANATATTVSATNTFYKIAGTTTASADNSKFTHSNNRLTCDAVISRKYLIQAHLSFTSGATNVCEFGFYDSVLAAVRTPSKTKSTANASGKAENISFACVVTLGLNDYIEIHGANTSAVTDITVDQLNFIITEIK